MSGGDKGKLAGGAAVGAGGILVAVLKSGSAEVHVAETGMRAAAHAGEVGVVARGAGELGIAARGAGELGAGAAATRGFGSAIRTGEHGAERLVLAGAAGEVEIRALRPVALGAVADDGAHAATTLTPVAAKATPKATTSIATRTAKVKEVLAHAAEDVDPKELLDRLKDVWDLSQALSDDEDEEVDKRFHAMGVDFKGDVVPSIEGKPLLAVPGATRALLSDGHKLVPAAELPDALPWTLPPTDQEKDELALGGHPEWDVYVQHPLPAGLQATSVRTLLLVAKLSPDIVWTTIEPTGSLPSILEHRGRRFVRVTTPGSDAGAPRVILLRQQL